jgi:hypothetical protein
MLNRKFLLFTLVFPITLFAQQFSGQWKGEFIDKSSSTGNFSGDKCEYVLELDVKGDKAIGSSYTYFTEGGKRYYTICKVEGTIDTKKKFIEIREIERTKTNIPQYIKNCFQIHQLTYFKKGNDEILEGKWAPAPNQNNCGYGNTALARRTLVNAYPNAYAKIKKEPTVTHQEHSIVQNQTKPKITKPTKPKTSPEITTSTTTVTNEIIKPEISVSEKIDSISAPIVSAEVIDKLEKRKNTVLKSIEIESDDVKIDLYDNGEIDGDSISLFYNNRLLLSNKRLSDKSISISLPMERDDSVNELVMYAENLGNIPPNTALMIVRDGPNRYEVRISSDLEKNGVIRFVHKKRKDP